ncbi:MAG: alpha-galactosidase [Phycisphaeraceae bacterium]|nr:alpha-galactosidase [Phycisphaeraceae bacterium]
MAIKVAFIGAGSVGFTRGLFRDILTVPELADTRFAFCDISRKNLDMVAKLCQRMIDQFGLKATIDATLDRRRALADADYVINCTRIGGVEAFAHDIDIPLKYGIDQCVGDTLCVGGIMYGQRNVPQILDFCRDMREVSKPNVLFLNYANPMAINTWAALQYGKVSTLGLCHGIECGWRQIDMALSHLHGDPELERMEECHARTNVICAGINHQTWFIKVLYKGREVGSEELLTAFEKHPRWAPTEKCRIDVLRRFGCFSTESNGHLSEYLPWYRKRPQEIKRWIDMSSWINGETGGYLRVCTESRNWFETDFPQWMKDEIKPLTPENRGHERGSYIIESLQTGRTWRGHVNVRNNGTITNLPNDAVIEAPCFIDRLGVHMPRVGDLPLACAATCSASISVQRMAVEAAVHGDATLLKQAALHDPLTGAVCNPEEVWQCIDEMLVAQAKWLPQYVENGEIAKAKARLKHAKPLGTHKSKGAARLKVRSITELRREKDKAKAELLQADKSAASRLRKSKA